MAIDRNGRIGNRRLSFHNRSMIAEVFIATRVTAEMKERFAAVARRQGLAQSVLLKRLVAATLWAADTTSLNLEEPSKPLPASGKISVRLRSDDLLLLRERASARGMPSSTYVTFLLRGHLRSLTPLPTAEFSALRKSLMEVAAIGRNFNQMARALNAGERSTGPDNTSLMSLLRVLDALREHFRKLLDANSKSWEVGYAKAPD
jgi:hypothetical protein